MALIVTAELTVCSAETQASHPELFHYTKPAAFESIVRSNSFWASHYPDIRDNALDIPHSCSNISIAGCPPKTGTSFCFRSCVCFFARSTRSIGLSKWPDITTSGLSAVPFHHMKMRSVSSKTEADACLALTHGTYGPNFADETVDRPNTISLYTDYISNKILFKKTNWSEREDSNLRPLRPERSALPG